jgi:phosphoenolpyruvate-protein phosphotransferase (PTS system enzyme I)
MAETMKIKEGVAASLGFAIGPVLVVGREETPIRQRTVSDGEIAGEVARFEQACAGAEREIATLCEDAGRRVGKDIVSIFEGHFAHLRDPFMRQEIVASIRRFRRSAEYAVSRYFRQKIRKIEEEGPAPFTTRIVEDIADLERRLLRQLAGAPDPAVVVTLREKAVLVAHNLSPAQTISLDREKVLGILTDAGGPTSHTALIARAYGIPAVTGLGSISTDVTSGDLVIVNGNQGLVIINPDDETTKRYQALARNFYLVERRLTHELRDLPAVTKDGHRVSIVANIEFPDEIPAALDHGAEGIGLFRTEFLYLRGGHEPTEEEQVQQYRRAVELLGGRKLVIRTIDVGMDKLPAEGWIPERNPFLGTRAIRLSLQHPEMFKTQLRAILDAAAGGNVELMFPMISSLEELREAKRVFAEVAGAPRAGRKAMPVGMMVEVPSAAIIADLFAPEVDFFSIGTNDLIQYAVAVDRVNERVASLYQPTHPAILRLLRDVFAAAEHAKKPTAVCGEMSSDILFTILLVGMGLKEFSVVPPAIPEIKRLIRAVTYEEAKKVAEKALQMSDAKAIAAMLHERTRQVLPDAL